MDRILSGSLFGAKDIKKIIFFKNDINNYQFSFLDLETSEIELFESDLKARVYELLAYMIFNPTIREVGTSNKDKYSGFSRADVKLKFTNAFSIEYAKDSIKGGLLPIINFLDNSIVDFIFLSKLSEKINSIGLEKTLLEIEILLISSNNKIIPELEILNSYNFEELKEKNSILYKLKEKELLKIDSEIILELKKQPKYLEIISKYFKKNIIKTEKDIINEVNLKLLEENILVQDFLKDRVKKIVLKNDKNEAFSNITYTEKSLEELFTCDNIFIQGKNKSGKSVLALILMSESFKKDFIPEYINTNTSENIINSILDKLDPLSSILFIDDFHLFDKEFQLKIEKFIYLKNIKSIIFSKTDYFFSELETEKFYIQKPNEKLNFIKNYEELYFYDQSKIKSSTGYSFFNNFLTNMIKSSNIENNSLKNTSELKFLLGKIAYYLTLGKINTLPALNSENILNISELDSFFESVKKIIKIDSNYETISFISESFKEFLLAFYLLAEKKENLNNLMELNLDFKDYKWRNSIIFISEFIIDTKEERLLEKAEIIESILKHLNSEKAISSMEKIINLTENNLSPSLNLYKIKYFYRIGKYSEAVIFCLKLLEKYKDENIRLNSEIFNYLSLCFFNLGLLDLAKISIVKGISLKSEEIVPRLKGTLSYILIDLGNFSEAKKLFEEKFKFTEKKSKTTKEFENEHKRNMSDMIYILHFEYSKENNTFEKAMNFFNQLIKDYNTKENIFNFNSNYLFYYANLSYFLSKSLLKEEEDSILLKLESVISNNFRKNILDIDLNETKMDYYKPLGIISFNLAKHYNLKNNFELAKKYLEKSCEYFSDYKTAKYKVLEFYYSIIKDDHIKNEIDEITINYKKELDKLKLDSNFMEKLKLFFGYDLDFEKEKL